MSDDLAAELPTVKPWDQRSKSVRPLAGGNEQYLDTLAWVLELCSAEGLEFEALRKRYATAFGLSLDVAYDHLTALRRYGLLDDRHGRRVTTALGARWLETRQPAVVIGTMHANVRFIGELLELARIPRSKLSLLQLANDCYGFNWTQAGPIDFRLCWLRSGGLVQLVADSQYQTTEAGVAFLERVELHPPTTASAPAPDEPSPEPVIGSPQDGPGQSGEFDTIEGQGEEAAAPNATEHRSAHDLAAEIGDRLESLSCDGSKHQELEVAVRDAFAFLGFSAERLSGPGQTDVLLTGVRPPEAQGPEHSTSWSYMVAVDAKASTNGKLADLQVTWPALALHREQHAAAFSVLVGPSPRSRLLQFAADASVTVLSAEC